MLTVQQIQCRIGGNIMMLVLKSIALPHCHEVEEVVEEIGV
jgi:hypothetical protein